MTTIATAPALDDVLVRGLDIVFCGTAAGNTSARVRRYYAGPGNQFWPTLRSTGLSPRLLRPAEFRDLPRYGIGLTDLCKHASGNDHDLKTSDFDIDIDKFWERIHDHAPRIVAFNGKQAAKIALRLAAVTYGPQPTSPVTSLLFVLPSTSGAARGHWNIKYWEELARLAGRN